MNITALALLAMIPVVLLSQDNETQNKNIIAELVEVNRNLKEINNNVISLNKKLDKMKQDLEKLKETQTQYNDFMMEDGRQVLFLIKEAHDFQFAYANSSDGSEDYEILV